MTHGEISGHKPTPDDQGGKGGGEDQIVPTHALKASTAFTFSHLTAGEKEESFIAATIAKQRLSEVSQISLEPQVSKPMTRTVGMRRGSTHTRMMTRVEKAHTHEERIIKQAQICHCLQCNVGGSHIT